jgi:hypothetical protein
MKKYFYVYYSYEEFGRGYIGKRECKCLPQEDIKYIGSYRDKSFKPTLGMKYSEETKQKIREARKKQCEIKKPQLQQEGN